tara:strand:- start:573 stop:749 length:177 start_codon:yes stop_codon:yes gene_type:complete
MLLILESFSMLSLVKEFFRIARGHEYSDLMEDTEWGKTSNAIINARDYSDLLEDTDWL